jgi:hypothetical protein
LTSEEHPVSRAETADRPSRTGKRIAAYISISLTLAVIALAMHNVGLSAPAALLTSMEACSAMMAAVCGIFALVRYLNRHSNGFLFVTAAMLGAAGLETLHLGAFTSLFPASAECGAYWSWIASRIFLSAMLILGLPHMRRDDRVGPEGFTAPR